METERNVIRSNNKNLIANTIRSIGPITIEDLVSSCNLSRPTVVGIVKELTENCIVEKVGFENSVTGRNPALIGISSNKYFSIGIDMEFPKISFCFMNLKSDVIFAPAPVTIHDSSNPNEFLNNLCNNIVNSCNQNALDLKNCIGIAVGTSGVIDSNKGIIYFAERAANFNNINVKEIISSKLNLPVYLQNDVHLLSLLEVNNNPELKNSNFIYLAVRSGVGATALVNGSPYLGTNGNSGYVGHMVIDINGKECKCGNKGCFELFVSKESIVDMYCEILNLPEQISDLVTIDKIFINAQSGEVHAQKIIDGLINYLSIGIINIVNIFDIYNVVIAGFPHENNHDFYSQLNDRIKSKRHFSVSKTINVSPSISDVNDCNIGCALYIVNEFFTNI